MKTRILLVLTILGIGLNGCEKDSSKSDTDYFLEIVGTYSGEFINQADLKSGTPGTATVTHVNSELQIHCFSDLIDTTFLMDTYENGDSIMICDTGSAFELEYGHMSHGGNHMMDMHNSESEWSHHLSDDHSIGDLHFGAFNMKNHSFEYKFRMMEGNSAYYIEFKGNKNQ